MSDAPDPVRVGHVAEMSPTGPRLGSPMFHALPVVEEPSVSVPRTIARECHMRSLSLCQNEPHCSDAGECVLYLAVGLMVGPYRLRRVSDRLIEIMNDGEGGDFSEAELAEVIGRFVSERL
jgi:hypothetical protein